MSICPVCTKQTFPPTGNPSSKILLIASKPDTKSMQNKMSWYIDTTNYYPKHSFASILKNELFQLGFDYEDMRKVYLWQHKPNGNEDCFDVGMKNVLMEAKGKQAILLLGAESIEYFTGYGVSDVSGLQVVCNMLSAPIIFASENPSFSVMGELRFALKNFTDRIIKEGIV